MLEFADDLNESGRLIASSLLTIGNGFNVLVFVSTIATLLSAVDQTIVICRKLVLSLSMSKQHVIREYFLDVKF